jgi:hypothetical protein
MVIRFLNVGRDKKSWTAEVSTLSDRTLLKEIRKHSALKSAGIDFDWNETGTGGSIYVGGLRNVGSFSVEGGFKLL